MVFQGYPREVQAFFQDLKAHNTKDWFETNRQRFDDVVMEPTTDLVAALAEPLSQLDPALESIPKVNKSIRRIFRDTRFSKDKTPYHTHLHLVFWTGDHPNRAPGVHIVLGDDHFGYGAGHWGFEAAQLDNYRRDIAGDQAKAVTAAVDAATKAGVQLDDPALARIPNGFDKDERWSGWARYKGLVVKSGDLDYPPELFGPEAVDYIAQICKDMQPLNKYLAEKVFE